jgi:hypothetical protein
MISNFSLNQPFQELIESLNQNLVLNNNCLNFNFFDDENENYSEDISLKLEDFIVNSTKNVHESKSPAEIQGMQTIFENSFELTEKLKINNAEKSLTTIKKHLKAKKKAIIVKVSDKRFFEEKPKDFKWTIKFCNKIFTNKLV